MWLPSPPCAGVNAAVLTCGVDTCITMCRYERCRAHLWCRHSSPCAGVNAAVLTCGVDTWIRSCRSEIQTTRTETLSSSCGVTSASFSALCTESGSDVIFCCNTPGTSIIEADDRQVTTVFTVQRSFQHRQPTNRVS